MHRRKKSRRRLAQKPNRAVRRRQQNAFWRIVPPARLWD